jgi:hypothetical protein
MRVDQNEAVAASRQGHPSTREGTIHKDDLQGSNPLITDLTNATTATSSSSSLSSSSSFMANNAARFRRDDSIMLATQRNAVMSQAMNQYFSMDYEDPDLSFPNVARMFGLNESQLRSVVLR